MRWKELSMLGLLVALVAMAVSGVSAPTALTAQAQGPASAQPRDPRIPFDRNGASFTSVLPFDQRFSLINAAPAPLLRVTTWYADADALPQAECSDLGARTRIRAAIRGAVKEKLGTLIQLERETVISALDTKLAAVPIEVFDTAGREELKKAFADTLGRHRTSNPAAMTALASALADSLNAVPIRSLSRSRWTRSTDATPTDTFSLAIKPLRPNRDFTFCVESVEALSATDSTALIGKIAAAVRKALRDHFDAHGGNLALPDMTLRRLQQTLRSAVLPAADSIVAPPGSLLAPAPPLANVIQAFSGIGNAYQSRCFFAGLFNTMAATPAPPPPPPPLPAGASPAPPSPPRACGEKSSTAGQIPLGWAVRVLARDSGLVKLARTTRIASRMPRPDTARIAVAAAVALALRGLACPANDASVCAEAETIARGQTPLSNPRLPTEGNANIETRSSSSDLRPWADNLDSTLVRLRELRDLVNYAAGDKPLRDSLGVSLAELDTARLKIEQARTAAAQQRINIRNVMERLDVMDAAVLGVASGVVARDLKQAGIATTSSASYETRARWHVGQDIGVLYAFRGDDTRETAPYLGVSIFLRPVNKRGELPAFCPLDLRCTGFNLGVTTSKFEEKDRYTGVLGGIPLVVGVGTRLGDFLRLSYNVPLVYTYRFDADGTAHRRLDRLNSVTLTLDADIRDILGGLSTSLFGK